MAEKLSAELNKLLEGVQIEAVPIVTQAHVNGAWLEPGGNQARTLTGMRFSVDPTNGNRMIGKASCGDTYSFDIPKFRAMLDRLAPLPSTNGKASPRKSK